MILGKNGCVISTVRRGIDEMGAIRDVSHTYRIHRTEDVNAAAYEAALAVIADNASDFEAEEDNTIWLDGYDPDLLYQREFTRGGAPAGLACEYNYDMRVVPVDSHGVGDIEYAVRVLTTIPIEGGGRECCNVYWHASTATDVCTAVLYAVRKYSEKHTGFGLIKESLDHAILQRSRTISGVTQALKHITHTGAQFHVEVFVVDGGERMGGAHETMNLLEPLPGSFKIKPPKNGNSMPTHDNIIQRYKFLELFYCKLSRIIVSVADNRDTLMLDGVEVGKGTPSQILAQHTWFDIEHYPEHPNSYEIKGTFNFGDLCVRYKNIWAPSSLDAVDGLVESYFDDLIEELADTYNAAYLEAETKGD